MYQRRNLRKIRPRQMKYLKMTTQGRKTNRINQSTSHTWL